MTSTDSKFNPLSCQYGKIVIQQRYVLCFMTFFAIVNCYNTRMCLSIAITKIAVPISHAQEIASSCPENGKEKEAAGGSYNWTEMQQGIILLSFFPGYLIMHLPAGILADRYGGRHVLSIGVLASAFITMITPAIIQKLNWLWLVFSRFALGVAQGGMYPGTTALLAHWVPASQRSALGSLVYSGIPVGVVTGLLFSGVMIQYFESWPVVFYVWGMLCLIWYGFFLMMCFSKPDTHPFITEKERAMLDNEFGITQRFKTPWGLMLKDSSVWAIIAAQLGHDWITYLIEVNMPKYFRNVLKMNVADNALVTSIPFIAMWFCSNGCGYLSDYIINKHNIKIVTMRIIYTTIASAGPSTLVLIGVYMGCNTAAVIVFYLLGMISMGPFYPGAKVNVLDLSINFSGVLMSLTNGIGVITGIAVPYLVAVIAHEQSMTQWQHVFWLAWVVCTVTNIVYIIWASGERRHWDIKPEVFPPLEEEN